MLRRLLLLLPLLLTACAAAPVIVYVTQPANTDGVLLPEQLQRAADAYTATARAMATQAAQTTATDQSSRATATTARQATLDALAARQTEAALAVTQSAAVALATDAASAKTQQVGQLQTWGTATAVALRTQSAVSAVDQNRRQAESASQAEFWVTLRFVFLALLIVGGLAWITVKVIDRVSAIRLARLRERAEIAREAFRLLPPTHWAEWKPDDGYQVYQLPGGLDEPPTVIENASALPESNQLHAWRQAVRLFCWWGDRYGFSLAKLGPAGAGVVSDPDWRVLSRLLKAAGVLADITPPGAKGKATGWAPQRNYRWLHDELGAGRLALPFPVGENPPKVAFAVPTQHHNTPEATRQHVN